MKPHINLHQADAVHSIKQCYVTSHSGVWIIEALYALDADMLFFLRISEPKSVGITITGLRTRESLDFLAKFTFILVSAMTCNRIIVIVSTANKQADYSRCISKLEPINLKLKTT